MRKKDDDISLSKGSMACQYGELETLGILDNRTKPGSLSYATPDAYMWSSNTMHRVICKIIPHCD